MSHSTQFSPRLLRLEGRDMPAVSAVFNTSVLTVLGDSETRVLHGRVVDLSGRGLRLILPEQIANDSAIKIEMGDHLLLGEVAYGHDWGGEWHIGVEVQQSLLHTPDLERLRRSLLEGDEKPVVTVQGVRTPDATINVTPHGSSERRLPQTDR